MLFQGHAAEQVKIGEHLSRAQHHGSEAGALELAAERVKLLEKESVELQQQAEKLADEIKELSGEGIAKIG